MRRDRGTKPFLRFLDVPTPPVTADFELGDVLGRGQYGTTRIAVEKKTGLVYACKSSGKRKMRHPSDVEDCKREIQVHKQIYLERCHPPDVVELVFLKLAQVITL